MTDGAHLSSSGGGGGSGGGGSGGSGSGGLRHLARRAASDPVLSERALAAARATASSLAALDEGEARRHLEAVTAAVAGSYADGRALSEQELRVIRSLGADRARQLVPLAALVTGFRAARNELVHATVDEARREGTDPAEMVDGLVELDTHLMEVEYELLHAYVEAEAELRRTNRDLEAGVVRQVLLGVLPAPEQLARAGLEPQRQYHCLVSDAADAVEIERANSYLEPATDAHSAVLDGYLVALVWRMPQATEASARAPGIMVVTPQASLERVAALYRLALRARDIAQRQKLEGLQPLQMLALDTAAASLAELGSLLCEQLNRALDPGRAYHREIVATSLAYLESGASIDKTAALLHLHPNTVKYRLRRLGEVLPGPSQAPWGGLSLRDAFSHWLLLSAWEAQLRRLG